MCWWNLKKKFQLGAFFSTANVLVEFENVFYLGYFIFQFGVNVLVEFENVFLIACIFYNCGKLGANVLVKLKKNFNWGHFLNGKCISGI